MRITQALVTRLVAGAMIATAGCPAMADDSAPDSHWYSGAVRTVKNVWHTGQPELYVPLHIHHLHFAYSREKIATYNETPLGLGLGRGIYEADGDWHGLYAMFFQDSHAKPEYIAGYAYKTYWRLAGELKFGLGYTVFLTARSDIGPYVPVPGILPIIALEYRNVSIDANYVPGGNEYGNVLFFYSKIRF